MESVVLQLNMCKVKREVGHRMCMIQMHGQQNLSFKHPPVFREQLHSMKSWSCASFFRLMFQEWDLSSDCVWDTMSTTTSAGGGEVAHCAPLSENPDSWTCRAGDQEGKNASNQTRNSVTIITNPVRFLYNYIKIQQRDGKNTSMLAECAGLFWRGHIKVPIVCMKTGCGLPVAWNTKRTLYCMQVVFFSVSLIICSQLGLWVCSCCFVCFILFQS